MRAGLTQAELARRAGIAASNLSAIESGKRRLSPAMEQRLRDALGLPSSKLRQLRDEVVATIERFGGSSPRVFGSVARGQDGPDSDIDILVHPTPGRAWELVTLPRVLSELLATNVDVVLDTAVSRRYAAIIDEAVPL